MVECLMNNGLKPGEIISSISVGTGVTLYERRAHLRVRAVRSHFQWNARRDTARAATAHTAARIAFSVSAEFAASVTR